ncbi:MAG: MFS transporter, partial [Chromatiaceae bacterium]
AVLAGTLIVVLFITAVLLPSGVGKMKAKPKFTQVFSNTPAINWLSAARFFLFGARDVWFVVALPVFLSGVLGWEHLQVGAFLAFWVIGYGVVQASAPRLLKRSHRGDGPGGGTARSWVLVLALLPALIAVLLEQGFAPGPTLVGGLIVFGVVFAINSAVHSYLILAYADADRVAMNVGFYYMANAGGRLVGTVMSGLIYQIQGLEGCLWWSTAFLLAAFVLSLKLPSPAADQTLARS